MNALKWIGSIFALIIIGLLSILIIIDPNDYRDDITTQAKENAGINLAIDGDISWSLLPLGFDLNSIQVLDQDQKTFTKFSRLTLQIDTLSLLALQPNIHTLLLDGLDVQLLKDEKGKANWEKLIAEKAETKSEPSEQTSDPESAPSSSEAISFLVEEIKISNANVNFQDKQSNQNIAISNLQLSMSNITLEQAFPVALAFDFSSNLIGDKTIASELNTQVALNLKEEKLSLIDLSIKLADLALKSNIDITQYTSQPAINAQITIEPFALNSLLSQLGQATIETTDPNALQSIGLSTSMNLRGNNLKLSDLLIKLDNSSWKGATEIDLSTQAVKLALNGDAFTVDGYLPPAQENPQADSEQAPAPKGEPDAPLLPLETLRGLNLDIALTQSSLMAKGLDFKDMDIALKAKNGLITLEKANTNLFNGSVTSSASIDAQTDAVAWASLLNVKEVNLFENIGSTELFGWQLGGAGSINLMADLKTEGNQIKTLQEKALGQIDLKIKDGALTGVNLNKLACEGFASLNREQITKTDWPEETQFNALEASVKINGNLIDSPKLLVENIGLRATGKGKVNLAEKSLAYYLDINPNGELGDEACRVREKIKGIAIPLKCEGNFDTPPAELCGLNTKKLGRIAEKLLKKEAERKVDKEIDRALDKKLDKYLEKDSDLGKALKKGLKGLFQ